jgi:hypothetical protein
MRSASNATFAILVVPFVVKGLSSRGHTSTLVHPECAAYTDYTPVSEEVALPEKNSGAKVQLCEDIRGLLPLRADPMAAKLTPKSAIPQGANSDLPLKPSLLVLGACATFQSRLLP